MKSFNQFLLHLFTYNYLLLPRIRHRAKKNPTTCYSVKINRFHRQNHQTIKSQDTYCTYVEQGKLKQSKAN